MDTLLVTNDDDFAVYCPKCKNYSTEDENSMLNIEDYHVDNAFCFCSSNSRDCDEFLLCMNGGQVRGLYKSKPDDLPMCVTELKGDDLIQYCKEKEYDYKNTKLNDEIYIKDEKCYRNRTGEEKERDWKYYKIHLIKFTHIENKKSDENNGQDVEYPEDITSGKINMVELENPTCFFGEFPIEVDHCGIYWAYKAECDGCHTSYTSYIWGD